MIKLRLKLNRRKDMDVEEKKDIFDKLMHLPVLNIFEPFYKKHKEVLMYLFFGGLTFFLNIALYAWLDKGLGMNALIANVICWVVCVLFQYFTNRTWVFDGQVDSAAGFLKQMASFFGGRLSDCGGSNPCGIYHLAWI